MRSWIPEPIAKGASLHCGPVALRLMRADDREALLGIALEPEIWSRSTTRIASPGDLDGYLEESVRLTAAGSRLTFAVEHAVHGLVGATALGNYSPQDARIEIGWTWLGLPFHGSGVNALAKSACLQLCFGFGAMQRVEFKTDVLNGKARRALIKIGACEEGVLRSHTLMPGGRRRDTIYYSVLRAEWPAVRSGALAATADIEIAMSAPRVPAQ